LHFSFCIVNYKGLFSHPLTRTTRRIIRGAVVTCAVILAVAFVTTITVDLGPSLRMQAEKQGSNLLKRTIHIGRLGVHLLRGEFVVEDLVIEGLTPQSRPFLTAKRIGISMPWSTLFDRRVVFEAVQMRDWHMYVELLPDGRDNFPKLPKRGEGKRPYTITLQYFRGSDGEFVFEDHGLPWTIVARNLDVIVAKPGDEYRGQAKFSNGMVAMQRYLPFRVDMSSEFKLDGSIVRFSRIDLTSEGAKTELTGAVDTGRWPEQTYQLTSHLDFATQKRIWFNKERFAVSGVGDFTGTFHMFRERFPDGRSRMGRELKGTFVSQLSGVNAWRFGDLRGSVLWTPAKLEVSHATASVYGGRATFDYRMEPLDQKGVRATATFDASYNDVNLASLTDFLELRGMRLTGRLSGRNLLVWPLGRFAEHHGDGEMHAVAAPGVDLMTRRMPLERRAGGGSAAARTVTPLSLAEPVPVGGDVVYSYGPEWVDVASSHVASESTYVEMQGRTAYGDRSRMEFHVSSADWQESDRVFAGILTSFGARTGVIPIGGYGTFDGVMVNSFRSPRIEGTFASEQMRAWDVVWGAAQGSAVIENSYADVTNVVVRSGESTIDADGRFSIGFPRRDGGEEINARVRIARRPITDLRRAFGIDEYRLDGLASGEFHVVGNYRTPLGFGTLAIADGVAWGEPFDAATAGVRLEGEGVRLDDLQITKSTGRATGAAFVRWKDATYSFNLDARNIPVESIARVKASPLPVSGLFDFTANGSGSFDTPRYQVRGTLRDFFVADEGVGQVIGDITIADQVMTLKVEAASPRLAVSGAGRINLDDQMNADISLTVADTSLDPYVRAFQPALSPYTTAVASGTIHVVGALADIDRLLVDARVERLDARLFDYQIRNAMPIRLALDRHSVRVSDMRLVGEGTQLDVSGVVELHDERIAMRATGDANLAVLQGFVANVRSSGQARLSASFEGSMRDPNVSGTFTIENGRLRHFAIPHALENISGSLQFDSRGVNLDGLSARIGGGPLQFGGRIDKQGYLPGRLDVTVNGRDMRLRFPEGMRSTVDASLALQGTIENATLTGDVLVRDGLYTREFNAGGGLLDLTGGTATSYGPTSFEPTLPLRYDIRINVPSTLQVRNRNARLVTNADLQLRGTYDRPLVFGRADVESGEFLFEGKRYLVTRGTIDFNNPTRIQPFIDLEMEARVRVPGETYRVTVRVAGTFDRLSLEFSADPPLPEVEVLALLFSDVTPGRDVEFRQYSTDITPQQQLLRERATRALTGAISSEVGRAVEQTFGVDTFQLTPSLVDPNAQSTRLDPAARLTIGKRLSERMYLTYARSLSSSTRDQIVLLEYDQTDRFSWILSRNEDRTYALEVRVRHVF
jgi:hypothetical protein